MDVDSIEYKIVNLFLSNDESNIALAKILLSSTKRLNQFSKNKFKKVYFNIVVKNFFKFLNDLNYNQSLFHKIFNGIWYYNGIARLLKDDVFKIGLTPHFFEMFERKKTF